MFCLKYIPWRCLLSVHNFHSSLQICVQRGIFAFIKWKDNYFLIINVRTTFAFMLCESLSRSHFQWWPEPLRDVAFDVTIIYVSWCTLLASQFSLRPLLYLRVVSTAIGTHTDRTFKTINRHYVFVLQRLRYVETPLSDFDIFPRSSLLPFGRSDYCYDLLISAWCHISSHSGSGTCMESGEEKAQCINNGIESLSQRALLSIFAVSSC